MRVLLTGSSGWLGRYLGPALRLAGHAVTGLDVAPGVETHVIGSVADRPLVDRLMAEYGIEAIIHSGALHKPDIVRYPAQAFIDTNVTGTLNLLEAAVAAEHDRFVFTSTTSLMITSAIRAGKAGGARTAAWLTEDSGPLAPRNIYGVTKYSAEHLCRLHHLEKGIGIAILRTGRFFPEDDDMAHESALLGTNQKANEFLGRRLTVEDAAAAHVVALERAPDLGCETFILAAPTPFAVEDAHDLMENAPAVIARYFPDAADIYARAGWHLPAHIDRVYCAAKAQAQLGFRCRTDFRAVLDALHTGAPMPFMHDPAYVSPKEVSA